MVIKARIIVLLRNYTCILGREYYVESTWRMANNRVGVGMHVGRRAWRSLSESIPHIRLIRKIKP